MRHHHPLTKVFHLFSLLQMPNNCRMVDVEFFGNFSTCLVAQTVKASAYNAGDPGSIPGLGRSTGEGNGNPLRCSCLENPMDRGAWQATVHRSQSRTRLSNFTSCSCKRISFSDPLNWSLSTCNFHCAHYRQGSRLLCRTRTTTALCVR